MRPRCCFFFLMGFATPAAAADLREPPPTAPVAQPSPRSFLSEIRVGGSIQDPSGPENGSGNITGEVVFARAFQAPDPGLNLLIPRVHLGGSANLGGRTSFAYAGFTWALEIGKAFLEGTLGGAAHNGDVGRTDLSPHAAALGCPAVFRESATAGFRFTQHWSAMVTLEHLSNAGLCRQNRGLTNVGLRIGYTF